MMSVTLISGNSSTTSGRFSFTKNMYADFERLGALGSFGNGLLACFFFHSLSSFWKLVYAEDFWYLALAAWYFALSLVAFLTKGAFSSSSTFFHILPRTFATSVMWKSGFS